MGEPNRSLKRSTAPIVKLTTPVKKAHVVGMKVMCACSDMKERQVLMDEKLTKAVLGFIAHRQGGTLQLSEGTPLRFEIQHQPSAPISGEKVGDVVILCLTCNHNVTVCQCPPCQYNMADGKACGLKPHQHSEVHRLHKYYNGQT